MKTLYVYKQQGCAACAAAEKVLSKWQTKQWGKVGITYLNVGAKDWEIRGYSPKSTPAYLLLDENRAVLDTHEGVMTEKQLNAFVSQGDVSKESEAS